MTDQKPDLIAESNRFHHGHVADTPECWDKCGDPTQDAESVAFHPAEIREMIGWIDNYHMSWAAACDKIRRVLIERLAEHNDGEEGGDQ